MGFFDNFFNFFSKDKGKQKTEEEIKPEAAVITGILEESFKAFVEKSDINASCMFFDPEESHCYVYSINDQGSFDLTKFENSLWKPVLKQLKDINSQMIKIGDREFFCVSSLFFTNLGERVVVLIFNDSSIDEETLKDKKRKAIHWVNNFKPATSLTRNNIRHLMELIAEKKDKKYEDFYDLLLENQVLTRDELDEIRKENNLEKILGKPVPRKLMVKTVARWMDVEYVDVEITKVNEETARKIPEELAKKYNILPFCEENGKIKVAFWNPFDQENVRRIKESLGDNIIFVMSCEEDIRYELEKIYD